MIFATKLKTFSEVKVRVFFCLFDLLCKHILFNYFLWIIIIPPALSFTYYVYLILGNNYYYYLI